MNLKARLIPLAAGAALTALTGAAVAQDVPLPKQRPAPTVTGSVAKPLPPAAKPAQRAVQAEAPAPAPPQSKPPSPISNPFAALLGAPGSTTALNPQQRAIIGKVDDYLSKTQILSGKFVQVGPDGRRSEGEFFIQKPGKVRFDYDPPNPISIVADGQTVVVRDTRLATQDVYPLSQTPLRFLLADHVDLMKDTNLVAVYADDVFITVVVEEKTGIVGTSRLMIMFSAKDMQLKQWTVTDPQGFDTTVAVYNLDTSHRPDPGMFHIDYTNYHN
ncbi:MAG TPA: outer membrane lipoprotein carrier protein LolA [Pseudolabrys sp.]|jgi:outer membrane lipoprotein-sorting protein|nr:outer membrane lipoprotein carrier protein LolA [Pseudolabrys sp.]